MSKNKVEKEYWENNWADFRIPFEISQKKEHQLYHVLKKILPAENLSLIEIGCAPGGWLVFFHKHFKFRVSGVDYAENACLRTEENLKRLNTPAKIYHQDVFKFKHDPFDIVFSMGFIEHFEDPRPIMSKISELCKPEGGLVITIIPSLQGLNYWISKTFRPSVAAKHRPVSFSELIRLHEKNGFRTLYVNSGRAFYILPPLYLNWFWKKFPTISLILNSPIHIWNLISGTLCRWFKFYPRFSLFSRDKVYIGIRS